MSGLKRKAKLGLTLEHPCSQHIHQTWHLTIERTVGLGRGDGEWDRKGSSLKYTMCFNLKVPKCLYLFGHCWNNGSPSLPACSAPTSLTVTHLQTAHSQLSHTLKHRRNSFKLGILIMTQSSISLTTNLKQSFLSMN